MTAAPKPRMTLIEFLAWYPDGERWELFDGEPVMMTSPHVNHRILQTNLTLLIGNRLAGRAPCRVEPGAGHIPYGRDDSYFEPDLSVTCAPVGVNPYWMQDAILIVEILSPSTRRTDLRVKRPHYRKAPSAREILFVDGECRGALLDRRTGPQDWTTTVLGPDDRLVLETVGADLPLGGIYEGLDLPACPADRFARDGI